MTNEPKCYSLPLAPQDLVEIYKLKEDKKDFILFVDYNKSREKLSAKHILIYLANTNFKTTFSAVDEDLILEYIKSDFLVDSPMLARFVVMIIKARFRYEFNFLEKQLEDMMSEDQFYDFVDKNIDLVDELCETFASVIPFALTKFYENLSDEDKEKEVELSGVVKDITVVDKPSNCGPNIANLIIDGWDGFLLVCSVLGFKQTYNKQVFNDKPNYFGKDLFFLLTQSNITNNILSMMPPGFIASIDIAPPKSEDEIIAEIESEINANDSTPE